MAQSEIPHFVNDAGVSTIEVGVKEFMCMGAKPPFDHPHVYLDMGADDEILCPYCSTRYQFNEKLHGLDSKPEGCAFAA